MKVLFLKDVPGVALGGDIKEVKNGYARNYLIPYNIAVLANNENAKQIEKIKAESEKERIVLMDDLKAVFESIKDLTINIPMLSSQTGKLYGSVGHDIISKTVKEVNNVELEDRYIKLTESIKEHGVYNVRVEISDELNTMIKVIVHDPEQTPEELLLSLNTETEEENTEEVPTAKEENTEEVPTAEEENTEEVPTAEEENTEEVPTAEEENTEEKNKN